ncbi:MAG: PEP/pyruvate-binding domain-containing protein [Candidatus Eisenbacteria bacterium]
MNRDDQPVDEILRDLQERAKELNCLYRVDETLSHPTAGQDELRRLVDDIPAGWQYPEACCARIVIGDAIYQSTGFAESSWVQTAEIRVEGEIAGAVSVFYLEKKPLADLGPFLHEEQRLINAIAERIGYHLSQKRLRAALESWKTAVEGPDSPKHRWTVVVDFLRNADEKLMVRITRRMLNHLCWSGYPGSEEILQSFGSVPALLATSQSGDENRPLARPHGYDLAKITDDTFALASEHLSDEEITECVQRWIREDRTSFLADTLENLSTSLAEVTEALERHRSLSIESRELPPSVVTSLKVSLLRRFFSDQIEFINIAKDHVKVEDFYRLLRHVIHPVDSHGKLGGKSAGLFIAQNIVREASPQHPVLAQIKVPKTWYITSDGILEFIRFNNLEDVYVRKYDKIEYVRHAYPYLVQTFKSLPFPPEMSSRLALALDDFEGRPIIVRSSSLLEDRSGSAFSGKDKSLFLANQGTREERLSALQDAIAEVYASTFGPDPIGYRAERGLLDLHEEMGIMIQEVVGSRLGRYFLPAMAGVAFTNNEFRWSPRIRREDGLIRLVPGLGTRAVDRVTDDYPVLVAPGQPGLRVNTSPDEIVRYAPRWIDVINLETNQFETMEVNDLIRECGEDYPQLRRVISLIDGNGQQIRRPLGLLPDLGEADFVVTFEGLMQDTPFLEMVRTLLQVLEEKMRMPVDLEFACDEDSFYLLQCRPQSYSTESAPAPIPRDLDPAQVLFTANRYVSNGRVPDLTHIVYVSSEEYAQLETVDQLREVGTVVRKLNKVLPKRQFALMGPGRWGSRGDIKLGVSVTYSDINNTAVLIEIARQKGNYVPDLSFGTHFFQDLVEAGIRYLPLYPDETDSTFQEAFFRRTHNTLPDLLPEHARLADVVHVVDVPHETSGRVLRILMNADLDEAIGYLGPPTGLDDHHASGTIGTTASASPDHWRWRLHMAERIGQELTPTRFGVAGLYLIGSTKNGTAGPGSDIDLLVHFRGNEQQRRELSLWFDGWSKSLGEVNYLRTGYASEGLLDVHWITDESIAHRDSFASKIDAITDRAHPLRMKP